MSRRVDARQVREENPRSEGEGLKLTWVLHGDHTSTGVVDIGAGGGLKPHIHEDHDEIVIILEGETEFRLGDTTQTLGAGSVISVTKGTVHAPVHSEGGCLLVSVFGGRFDPENPDRVFIED